MCTARYLEVIAFKFCTLGFFHTEATLLNSQKLTVWIDSYRHPQSQYALHPWTHKQQTSQHRPTNNTLANTMMGPQKDPHHTNP